VKGSIEAAVERALRASDTDARVPREPAQRYALMRLGLVPWLAGIDPETGAPRRRVARLSEIPVLARPLIDQLVEQRLLATDVARDTGETTIEPAHEALLRQWAQLQSWLKEDAGLLTILDGIKRAARDWAAQGRSRTWLAHSGARLTAAENLSRRADLAASLEETDRAYIGACRAAQVSALRRSRAARIGIGGLAVGLTALVGWINQDHLTMQYRAYAIERPFVSTKVRPHILKTGEEYALRPGQAFRECDETAACPEMVVLAAGRFVMGSPETENRFKDEEGDQREVTIARPLAVSKTEVTVAEWSLCVRVGDCPAVALPASSGDGHPVVNVSWNDARAYVTWLARITGKPYRLLSEAEWEYAARAGATSRFSFGEDANELCRHANIYDLSRPRADTNQETVSCNDGYADVAPVGRYLPNAFGLYDMHGNVWEWVEDCWSAGYAGAPSDGSAYLAEPCEKRMARGGAFDRHPKSVRSANRYRGKATDFYSTHGFRVGRSLAAPGG
jgi:formylglycine-generating enzyme required for sulfatase activity